MLLILLLTFLLTTALYGVLLWLVCCRVLRHLQGNAEAVKAVTDHVFIPLLGKQAAQALAPNLTEGRQPDLTAEGPPKAGKSKGTLL
jgi:hypothetical protein